MKFISHNLFLFVFDFLLLLTTSCFLSIFLFYFLHIFFCILFYFRWSFRLYFYRIVYYRDFYCLIYNKRTTRSPVNLMILSSLPPPPSSSSSSGCADNTDSSLSFSLSLSLSHTHTHTHKPSASTGHCLLESLLDRIQCLHRFDVIKFWLMCLCVEVHKIISLMSSSLLLQQCLAWSAHLSWMVCVMEGK